MAVGLGGNLPSSLGPPSSTLIAVRPKLEREISKWVSSSLQGKSNLHQIAKGLRFRWSPLFETDPLGGPINQPSYINAALVIDGPIFASIEPSEPRAMSLLKRFFTLERDFGRTREFPSIRWGPRTLDLDLLAWGELQIKNETLTLPHPRLIERSFVIVPLGAALTLGTRNPRRMSSQENWPE